MKNDKRCKDKARHMDPESEHIKEVYAQFGLAIYYAQVLEHGIVNALVTLHLIPSRRHQAKSAAEWGSLVDEFMSHHFETTLGRMIRDLRTITTVPPDLEDMLRDALRRRNFLAHNFFRERAEDFITESGRNRMLAEIDECREALVAADQRLDEIAAPLRRAAGITDEMVMKLFDEMTDDAKRTG